MSIEKLIIDLKHINRKIKELNQDKMLHEMLIAEELNHGEDYAKTYTCGDHKVTVTSGYNYKIDKKMFDKLEESLIINPFKLKAELKLDKAKMKEAFKYGNKENKDAINAILTGTPSKIHVKIGE